MAAPKKIDYERIEPAWRAGILSPIQLAADYTESTGVKVSHTAISKHFKKLGIPRDLAARVKSKAEAMVLDSMVSPKVSGETTKRDAEIIQDAAAIVAAVQIGHRGTSRRLHTLGLTLLSELESQSADIESLAKLGELMRKPDDKGVDKLNELYQKIISTPSRVDSAKKSADALKIAIGMERESYGLDDKKAQATSPGEISITF